MKLRVTNRHTFLLTALALGMFGFAFALVPLYNVFCEITGLNGKTSAQAALVDEIGASGTPVDRKVAIEFLAQSARGLPWEFRPTEGRLVVQPGEMHATTFYVRNRSPHAVTGQAVPSVSPGQAARYLKKLECFCFEQQELPAGGEMEMGVSFVVDSKLPPDIRELTLSYTMFRVEDVEHEHITSRNE
ncbi:MAG TPA: cytochrome c oxidase assembly protein [Woeseiaceae bacterium]|nr:cytochrome c oxidase assembly protein [Woeseiaceae bacterium]